MENFKDQLITALNTVGSHKGVLGNDLEEATMVRFNELDSYLAVRVLGMMIESGDIEVNIVGDSIGKKDYLEKLLEAVVSNETKE